MCMPLLSAKGLSLRLPNRTAQPLFGSSPLTDIFTDVDIELESGESLGVVGESGSGKTSIAPTLPRMYSPPGGQLSFEGKPITRCAEDQLRPLRARMQMIFQDSLSSLNPR